MATAESSLNPNERNERLWRHSYNAGENESSQSGFGKGAEVNVGDNERVVSGIGGGLVYRSATGHCNVYDAAGINTAAKENMTSVKASSSVRVDQAMTINAPVEEIYSFWRKFSNLPQFMYHLESVTEIDQMRSHWKAKAPLGMTVEWDAEIVSETPNQLISWRSVEDADVSNAGSVRFLPSTGGRGTVVKVELRYEPPAGKLGAAIAWLTGEEPSVQVREDLRRFKQLMETGEIPTIEGQSAGRATSRTKLDRK
jgi:uncharacterized membrane protein